MPSGLARFDHTRESLGLSDDESATPSFDRTLTFCIQSVRHSGAGDLGGGGNHALEKEVPGILYEA